MPQQRNLKVTILQLITRPSYFNPSYSLFKMYIELRISLSTDFPPIQPPATLRIESMYFLSIILRQPGRHLALLGYVLSSISNISKPLAIA
jgi:hypothetical protein